MQQSSDLDLFALHSSCLWPRLKAGRVRMPVALSPIPTQVPNTCVVVISPFLT